MELQSGFENAMLNQQLIHGVLKRVHIYPTRFDYDDYFQEATIIYAQTYVDYCRRDGDLGRIKPYIFQKLVWRLTDMLRQEKKYHDFHSLEEFDFQRVPENESSAMLDFIDWQKLTLLEREMLQEHFIQNRPLSILAKCKNTSTRNLRYRRDRLLKKLREMEQQ
ncbi:sigma-70 family RNA polymerase sigma factor [Companilactobacillus alimentarius]|uniref:RNA polymerase sigma-70 region 2 domain-containing protein n=1 Tax=Companilactobacillus alimentarius DSM 20249 TaxID=1423720 RepID=A0A2K9HKS7_9LACO|nr:sigma-70 family RNA polymerase sigma factor [Companilactobacillus alimentarius]AUI72516.1 hypothetical protein LA20249_10120 [Companilactobacillus alimentarius DSM 20249]KRK77715.1 RNA polymerase sigma factor [Companilactobacillus alimentarius DSM 20249]MDT6953109.1 sigma-70 family RNA polymerase sigma factor [Companilactobacillus alimentarius]GEO45049.1 hypothetical protein LAL01_12810 [Companilactobacillus alimentarius]